MHIKLKKQSEFTLVPPYLLNVAFGDISANRMAGSKHINACGKFAETAFYILTIFQNF